MKYQVKIRKVFDTDKPVKALASVTIENKIAIHGVRVDETEKGRFVAMPFSTSKDKDGNEIRRDVVHPISAEARKEIECAEEEVAEEEAEEVQE